MKKYSKIRIVLAGVLLFSGLQIAAAGFFVIGVNLLLADATHDGLRRNIVQLGENYSWQGLRDNFTESDFDKGISELKANLKKAEQGEFFGAVGVFSENIVVLLCFLVGALFFLSGILTLMGHPFLDVCIKWSMPAVVVLMIFLCWHIIHQMMAAYRSMEMIMQLQAMLKSAEEFRVVSRYSMLRSLIFSPAGILSPILIFLFYCVLPTGLYTWIKNREKS